jgi:hypothetical protein
MRARAKFEFGSVGLVFLFGTAAIIAALREELPSAEEDIYVLHFLVSHSYVR